MKEDLLRTMHESSTKLSEADEKLFDRLKGIKLPTMDSRTKFEALFGTELGLEGGLELAEPLDEAKVKSLDKTSLFLIMYHAIVAALGLSEECWRDINKARSELYDLKRRGFGPYPMVQSPNHVGMASGAVTPMTPNRSGYQVLPGPYHGQQDFAPGPGANGFSPMANGYNQTPNVYNPNQICVPQAHPGVQALHGQANTPEPSPATKKARFGSAPPSNAPKSPRGA